MCLPKNRFFFSPSYGVNTTKHRFLHMWCEWFPQIDFFSILWYECVCYIDGSHLCGMNMSTKSQDVVWMCTKSSDVVWLCLPNLMMRYECVYQVLWCNNNNCISNVPSPSMTTCVRLKALYMKQQHNLIMHYISHYPSHSIASTHAHPHIQSHNIHTCTPTHTISQHPHMHTHTYNLTTSTHTISQHPHPHIQSHNIHTCTPTHTISQHPHPHIQSHNTHTYTPTISQHPHIQSHNPSPHLPALPWSSASQ